MKCNEVLQHLNEYIENDLDERLMDEIRHHVEACSECTKVYEEEKELNDMFLQALNSEPLEFNSHIGNIMNMIDKDKYSSRKEENEVIEPVEDSKVIKFESVNKKKEKKLIGNKKIIAMAATFTIMIFMAPFIIGEQKKDIEYAVDNNKSTRAFDQANYNSNKTDDMESNKEDEKMQFTASVEKVEEVKDEKNEETKDETNQETNQEINESDSKEDVAVVETSNEDSNNERKVQKDSMVKASLINNTSFAISNVSDYQSEYLEKEYQIILSNEESKTIIKINNQEKDIGIIDGTITSFVEDDEYVYIACVGKDPEKESLTSKILKVNIKTNKMDIVYTIDTSLKQESVIKLELEEEKINFIIITGEEQEKIGFIIK